MRRFLNFFSRKQNWVGLIIVLIFASVAVAAPKLSPQTPSDQGFFKRVGHFADLVPHPPSEKAFLGTLPGQYDVFHTLVWGTRNALQFGLLVALISAFVGVVFGAVSGYAGGWVNNVMMRISDAFLAFPIIAGVVFFQQLFIVIVESAAGFPSLHLPFASAPAPAVSENSSLQNFLNMLDPLMLSLIIFSWMPYARLVNSMVLGLKNMEFVLAARALGASPARIIRLHLIPNSISPAIVLAARDVGSVVLLQATLTFIQIGGNSPWGELLARGRNYIIGPGGNLLEYWWLYIPATLTVILFGVSWNLLGDGINDVLSPESFVHVERSSRARKKKEENESGMRRFPLAGFGPDPVLAAARNAVGHKDINTAMHAYAHLVERGRVVNVVIRDLAEIARKNPRDARVWMALGDALARNGEPEDAQRAYAQADKASR